MPSFTTLCLVLCILLGATVGWHFGQHRRSRHAHPAPPPAPSKTLVTLPAPATNPASPSSVAPGPAPAAPPHADPETEKLPPEIARLTNLIAEYKLHHAYLEAAIHAFHEINQEHLGTLPNDAVARQSLFKNDAEFGDYAAAINLRQLAMVDRFPNDRTPTKEEEKEWDAAREEILADLSTALSDPYIHDILKNPAPDRLAGAQAAVVAPTLGLDPAQAADLRQLLAAAYAEGLQRKLEMVHRPDPADTAALRAWEQARADLKARAATQIKTTLTPEQLRRFHRFGYDDLIFNFRLGLVE
jgi:hypothetical protein